MSTSYIIISLDSDDESANSSISYIILSSDSEAEDTASPAVVLASSLDYEVEHDLKDPSKEDLTKEETHIHHPLRKTVQAPYILAPAIEAAIAEEIVAPPRKRTRSPLPPPSPSSPSSPSSPLSSSSSPSPLPSLSPPPRDTLPPHKRLQMTSPHLDTTDEAVVEAVAHHRRSAAHH
ncbi:hypothetical protein Tco_0545731 [Tanacetum coccineum]